MSVEKGFQRKIWIITSKSWQKSSEKEMEEIHLLKLY